MISAILLFKLYLAWNSYFSSDGFGEFLYYGLFISRSLCWQNIGK